MFYLNIVIDILIFALTMNKSRTIFCLNVVSFNSSSEHYTNNTSLRNYNDSYALHASININHSSRDLMSKLSKRDLNSASTATNSHINESTHFKIRSVCNSDNDCKKLGTLCDLILHMCHCERGYVPNNISSNTKNGNGNSGQQQQQKPESRYCVKPAAIGDHCITDQQCYLSNTVCIGNERNGKQICQCKENYFSEDGFEKVTIDGFTQESRVVCRYYHQGISSTYIGIIIFFALLTVIAVIICVIAIIKIKSNKRLYGSERLPGSDQYNNDTATASTPANNNTSVSRDLSNLPPMGSAEAEFQNDFIPVFPMRQLEPCPEKNTTALNMQFSAQG